MARVELRNRSCFERLYSLLSQALVRRSLRSYNKFYSLLFVVIGKVLDCAVARWCATFCGLEAQVCKLAGWWVWTKILEI